MINLYRTTNRLITNIYINLDYVRSKDRLLSIFSHPSVCTNIENSSVFIDDLIAFGATHTSGLRKDRVLNYGVVLTFMINNPKTSVAKLSVFSEALIKAYGLENYPYYGFVKKFKKSLYLVFFVCERKYYKTPKMFEVKAKQTRYKHNGIYCKASEEGAKPVYMKGDVIRTYYSKFSSKTQKFRYANSHHFLCEMSKYKLIFIDLCVKYLNEHIRKTITFKRFSLKQLNFREKTIARIWTKSYEKMEKEFYNAYLSLTFGEQEKLNSNSKQAINLLYSNYNEMIISNYRKKENEKFDLKRFYSKYNKKNNNDIYIDFRANKKEARKQAKVVFATFKKNLNRIVRSYMYDKVALIH